MNKDLVRKLILYIVGELADLDAPISTIRVIKLLYLVDLEHAASQGVILTNIPWIKYHYGPYFMEWPALQKTMAIDLEVKEVKTEHGVGKTYKALEEVDLSRLIRGAVKGIVDNIIKMWGLENLEDLLRHVYATPPLVYSTENEPLDFSYLTDHFLLKQERLIDDDYVSLDDLKQKYGNPF